MESMTERILNWVNEKNEDIDIDTDKHSSLKLFGLGMIKGVIDGAVFMYVPVLIASYYWQYKATKNDC